MIVFLHKQRVQNCTRPAVLGSPVSPDGMCDKARGRIQQSRPVAYIQTNARQSARPKATAVLESMEKVRMYGMKRERGKSRESLVGL